MLVTDAYAFRNDRLRSKIAAASHIMAVRESPELEQLIRKTPQLGLSVNPVITFSYRAETPEVVSFIRQFWNAHAKLTGSSLMKLQPKKSYAADGFTFSHKETFGFTTKNGGTLECVIDKRNAINTVLGTFYTWREQCAAEQKNVSLDWSLRAVPPYSRP